jgi:DNA phosphorothioation-dependent restriction protein DptG
MTAESISILIVTCIVSVISYWVYIDFTNGEKTEQIKSRVEKEKADDVKIKKLDNLVKYKQILAGIKESLAVEQNKDVIEILTRLSEILEDEIQKQSRSDQNYPEVTTPDATLQSEYNRLRYAVESTLKEYNIIEYWYGSQTKKEHSQQLIQEYISTYETLRASYNTERTFALINFESISVLPPLDFTVPPCSIYKRDAVCKDHCLWTGDKCVIKTWY